MRLSSIREEDVSNTISSNYVQPHTIDRCFTNLVSKDAREKVFDNSGTVYLLFYEYKPPPPQKGPPPQKLFHRSTEQINGHIESTK